MTEQFWFWTLVIMPAVLVAGGYVAVRLHERSLAQRRQHPAE